MTDIATTLLVVVIFALITAGVASRFGRALMPLVWLAFAEYFGCAVVQYFFGVDAETYRLNGIELAKLLDLQFDWMSGELLRLLFHRPTSLDRLVVGAGTNTASMSAIAAWFIFLLRGSAYAGQALVTGLSMVSAFALFDVLRDECPEVPSRDLFLASVLFPSIAFWTAAFHKESFCLMGTSLAACGWRAARKRQVRGILYGSVGLVIIGLFRAPALPPLLLGVVLHFVVERTRRARGVELHLIGPVYLGLGIALIGAGMIAITKLFPALALDNLGETVTHQQQAWSAVEGGSSFDIDNPADQSLASQLVTAPLALFNALLRPQIFDVRNPLMLVSAVEMTGVAFVLMRTIKRHGIGGIFRRIQSSPIGMLCAVVTFVGMTFVGLTTRNFGSLARYRVPFLPFYGSLLAILTHREQSVVAPRSTATRPRPARIGLRGRTTLTHDLLKRHERSKRTDLPPC